MLLEKIGCLELWKKSEDKFVVIRGSGCGHNKRTIMESESYTEAKNAFEDELVNINK